MRIDDRLLSGSERIIFALEELYLNAGYLPYRMGKFEEYDLYANNKSFLVSDRVITFTDTDGTLMALKPDVTLSMIKNLEDARDRTQKLFYRENVYRVSGNGGPFREIMQTGLECIGRVGDGEIAEVLSLAAESLKAVSEKSVLAISDLDVTETLFSLMDVPQNRAGELWNAIGGKNAGEIYRIAKECGSPVDIAEKLAALISLSGSAEDTMANAKKLLAGTPALDRLNEFASALKAPLNGGLSEMAVIDFSVTGDVNYYTGIIFKGFVSGVPTAVLSGGRYDRLMRSMKKRSGAVGFAVYTDALLSAPEAKDTDGYIDVALPKGRLGDAVYSLFEKAGYGCKDYEAGTRKLIFDNAGKRIRFFWVKPSDVAVYVERGAADVGVVGKDVLIESDPDVYELLDLGSGRCRMAVAAKNGYRDDPSKPLTVATKYPNTAKKYYLSKGRGIDVIKLNGSIELAPVLGLSDVIVDIVETGTTLKENDLSVIETVREISAILIANKPATKFMPERIKELTDRLRSAAER